MNVFYESLSIRESIVLKDKEVIREVNGFYLAIIMNYLMDTSQFRSNLCL